MKNPTGKSFVKMLAFVLGMACTLSAPAQTFKHVSVKGAVPLVQIAAGGASVWALSNAGHPYIFKTNKFILANSIFLTQIAAGGGNTLQADAVWGVDSSGNVYTATKSGASWVFSQAPGVLNFIAVGPGYQDNCHPYEVWGLNPSANIYRFNYCVGNWDFVPGTLATLAVGGGGDIWGINGNNQAFVFNFQTLTFEMGGGSVVQVTVGPNGAWLLTTASKAYQVNADYGIVGSPTFNQIQAGGNGVWGIGPSQTIFRLETNTMSFVQIPGALVSISVGSGGGVWGLDGSGKAYGFTTP